jgi:hypothetical protein
MAMVNGPELTKYNIYLSYYRSLDTTTDRLLVLDGIILLKVSLYGLIYVLLKNTTLSEHFQKALEKS